MRAPKRTSLALAPAVAPGTDQQQQQQQPQELLLPIPFLKDKHYGMHGKIVMLILVAIFSAFIFFMAVFPCLKRAAATTSTATARSTQRRCSSEYSKQKTSDTTATEDGARSLPPQPALVVVPADPPSSK